MATPKNEKNNLQSGRFDVELGDMQKNIEKVVSVDLPDEVHEYAEHQDGNNERKRKTKGQIKFTDLTIEVAIKPDGKCKLWNEFDSHIDSSRTDDEKSTIRVTLYSGNSAEWEVKCQKCTVYKYSGPSLDATTTKRPTETYTAKVEDVKYMNK